MFLLETSVGERALATTALASQKMHEEVHHVEGDGDGDGLDGFKGDEGDEGDHHSRGSAMVGGIVAVVAGDGQSAAALAQWRVLGARGEAVRVEWVTAPATSGSTTLVCRNPLLACPRLVQDADSLHVHLLLATASALFVRAIFSPKLKLLTVKTHHIPLFASPSPSLSPSSARIPTLVHFPDLDTVLLATQTGSIVVVSCPRSSSALPHASLHDSTLDAGYSYAEMTLPRPSSISSTIHSILAATPIKLLSSWTGGSSATASPAITTASNHASQTAALASDATAAPHASAVAFASISHEEGFYAFTLGRDRRLRVYDLVTCSLVKSYSLVGHVLRDASLAFALDEATSNAGTTTSVSGVASGVAALGFSSNNKDNIGSELPLLPGVSPHSKGGSTVYMAGICNSIRIFGKTRIASKGGPHLRFKLAVYLHIPALPAVADSAPASGFVLFEGELNSEGGWRQMHILGTRGGLASSLLEGEVVKDFAIVQHRDDPAPSVGGARQLALDIEDDVAEIVGTLPTERFQIWVLTDNPYTRAAAAAVRASLVAWTDLRVRGIEDGAGARVEAAGGRWCVTAVRAAGPGVPPSVLDGRGMAAGRSPNDYYAAFVFDVARYSARTVLLALEEYVEQFGKGKELQELFLQRGAGAGYVDVQVLRALCKEVVAHYSLDVSNTNLADLGQIVAREWVQFAEICGDMAAAEHRALGLYAEEEPATAPAGAPFPRLVVVRRSRLGTVRFMDPCELVGHARDELLNGAGLNLLPTTYFEEREALLTARYGALPRVRGELLHLFEAVALVRTAVAGDDGGYAFLQACKTFVMEGVFAGGVDVAFKKVVMGKGDLFSGLKVAEFVTHMKRFDDAGAFFEAVLDLFAGKTGWDGGPMFGRDAVMDSGAAVQAHKLWVGASLLVETFAEVCAARLRLAEDVLLVLAAATAVPELDKLVERKVLAGALGAHQLCLVASTIAGLAVDVYESVAMEADMMDMDLFHSAKTAIVHTIPLSLLLSQTLCESKTPDPATSVEGRSLYLLQSVYSILSFFGLFSRDMKDDPLKLPPRLLVGAHVLAANGFAEAAWGLVELFPRDTYGAQYLEGYIKLKAGRFEEKAGRSDEMEKAFRQAASSFGSGGKVSDKQLATLLDESDVAGGVLGYYQHVIRLLEEARVHKMVTVFAKQALDSMSVKEKTEKRELAQRLWKTMFNHSLEAKEFVNAHMVLIGEKDPEVRKYSIRSFVTAVCESNETEALAERFSFGPLQFEVEETLLFKAKTRKVAPIPPRPGTNSTNVRNSDPNYHLILYSYYTSREDYRNAAKIMYDYARRLNTVISSEVGGGSLAEVIVEQARAYLAAINSLGLVREDSRYVLYRTSEENVLSGRLTKRRKVSALISESDYGATGNLFSPGASKQEVVDISEVKKEYALAMAKLTLAERYHELDVSPGLPDPEIAVALLLQEFKFDAAFKLAKTFDIGLETVFSEFGACCVSLTENDKNGTPTYMKPLIEEAPVGWEGSASAKAWLALQLRLEHYQSDYRINVYRKAAIDGSLSKNSKIDLPLWLVKSLQDAKPEDLIRVYLHHNLVERAAVIATEFVQKRTKALPDYGDKIKPSHCNKWLPFGTIDQTLVALDGELQRLENLLDEDDEMNCDDTEDTLQDLEKRRKELAGALYQYLSKIRDETLIFAPNTNMESAPLADQISFSLKYDVQPEDRVSRGGSGGGGGGVFSRLGPAITSPSGHSTLARLGPEISTPSKIGSTGAGAFSFSGSGASAFGSISGAATANFANTSTRGSSGGGLFGDLAPVVAFNTFGASSLTPPPPSNSLSFGAGPGLSPDGPKEYAGEKYKKRAERKGANPI